ncbi:AsmA-like C-terminal region-containing protein [Gangjinia marincola]|uniref:AsmA-like C-terminal region-containing protein n=1 Tax=Gangjinia marincola TaxID=578463 RepID=A0ABN1ME11_9FLAO
MKKALKIIGIVLGILIILLIAAPFIFKGNLEKMVNKAINDNLNARVAWQDLSLSLLKGFPNATLTLDRVSVINNAPFEGDTLAFVKNLSLKMSVKELFKGAEEAIKVDELIVNKADILIKVDSLSNANYDIAVTSDAPQVTEGTQASQSFTFDVNHYEINESSLVYDDKASTTYLTLSDFTHEGTGDFSANEFILETTSSGNVSFAFDGINYLNENHLDLDANFQLNLENQTYTFLENSAHINDLPLEFDGFVKVNEDNNEIDLSFKTPSSDFKNFLAVIPEVYRKNLDGVTTTGDFIVDGKIKGIADENTIPTMDIAITSNNASFKFSDLPKRVEDISIDTKIINETGKIDDTYVNINQATFRIDQDVFALRGSLKNLTQNMLVNLGVKGTLNLANLDKAYPLELEQKLQGILNADLTTNFDMASLENEQYQNVKSQGSASIKGFSFSSPEIPNPVQIAAAALSFTPGTLKLTEMQLTSGSTDMRATGTINNLLGYLFTDQNLKGVFDVSSNTFALNDFMIAENNPKKSGDSSKTSDGNNTSDSSDKAIKIPSFLDATLNFRADKILYDNLSLTNARGTAIIKDEKAEIKNFTSDIFKGKIAVNGNVSTKNEIPTFAMNVDLNAINIAETFEKMELIKGLAPIAKALAGSFNTTLSLDGNLTKDLTPVLNSVKGNALATLLEAKVNSSQTPLLSKLDQQLNFVDLDKINLNNLTTQVAFEDGQINVKPFDFDVKDIKVNVSGGHGFDNQLNYNVALDIPAKYLGDEVGGKLASLSQEEVNTMKVDLPIQLTGSFLNPTVKLNTKAAITNLTQQIVAKQKEKLKEKGEDKLNEVISDIFNKNKKDSTAVKQDSTKVKPEDAVKDIAKDVLGGLFGRKKKAADSTNKGN